MSLQGIVAAAPPRDEIGRGWDRAMALYAALPGDRLAAAPIDRGSRMIVHRPGDGPTAAACGSVGASWDRALTEHRL